MPKQNPNRAYYSPTKEMLRVGARVVTADGPGKVAGYGMRKNTNGGPGCRQYRVRLDDGRLRHYAHAEPEAAGSMRRP